MTFVSKIIEAFFLIALLANALLFIAYGIKMVRKKSSQGLSVLILMGCSVLQLMALLQELMRQNHLLSMGYLLNILSCGWVICLTLRYRNAPNTHDVLADIIALMPGHVYWVDAKGVYLGCNDNQAKSAGLYHRKDIVGKKNADLPWNIHSQLPQTLDDTNQKVIQTAKAIILEEPAVLQDGSQLIFLSHKVPLYHQKTIIGMVGISIDITDRKKAEASLVLEKINAETANNAKTEFLNNMRHDIRTALTGIVGFSELLKNECNIEKIRVFAKSLYQSSTELLRFLNEVLESVQVGSGELPLFHKRFSLSEILEKVISLHRPIALNKNLELSLYLDPAIPHYLIGDPIRIYRIILEILANALKFTDEGQVKITTILAKQFEQKVILKIAIEDTGVGIPLDKQSQLFVRFKRLMPSYEGIYKGMGLGLSIVKQFIEDINAEIELVSIEGKGSCFVCIIPLKIPLL